LLAVNTVRVSKTYGGTASVRTGYLSLEFVISSDVKPLSHTVKARSRISRRFAKHKPY